MRASADPQSPDKKRLHRVIVTGGSGTLGRHVLERVAAWPRTAVLALLRKESQPPAVQGAVRFRRVEFEDPKTLTRVIKAFRPTTVIHCAASGMQLPRPPWPELVRFNVGASLQLCEITASVPNCQFVHISSGLAYRDQDRPLREDDPLESRHPYGVTKAVADMLLRAAAAELPLPMTIVRPFSFSGAGDTGTRLFPALLRAAAEKRPFDLSRGDQARDHCAVDDIARGIALAAACREGAAAGTEVFNLGSGDRRCLRKLIESLVEELGLDVRLNFGARDYAPFEPKYLVADISRARRLLDWKPQTNFAYAIWQLARELVPNLRLKRPKRWL